MKKKPVLLIDIGNTSTCLCVGSGKSLSEIIRLDTAGCTDNSIRKVISNALSGLRSTGSVLCSVVPKVNRLWIKEIVRATGKMPIIVNHRLNLGLKVNHPKPSTIGADRLANVCGAVARYGFPVLIADFGTAATFDIVSSKGIFIGGVIAPGPGMMTDYMADRTALLPRIRMVAGCNKIGRNTRQAMLIGATIGYRGLIREITEYLVRENNLLNIKLVATGGMARRVIKGLNIVYCLDAKLTLWGLYKIYQLNSNE